MTRVVIGVQKSSISLAFDDRQVSLKTLKLTLNMDKTNSQPGTPMETSPLMSVEITEIIPCEEISLGNMILGHVKRNLLLITTLIGVVVGFGIGFGVRPYQPTDTSLMWIGKILFLRVFFPFC